MANIGDIRQLTLKKLDFRVTGGSDFSRKTGKWEKENVPTSGVPDIKYTKQTEDVESVEIQVTGAERELVRDLANETENFDMAYVTARGDTYTNSGQITVTADSTSDGKMTLSLLVAGEWAAIVV